MGVDQPGETPVVITELTLSTGGGGGGGKCVVREIHEGGTNKSSGSI